MNGALLGFINDELSKSVIFIALSGLFRVDFDGKACLEGQYVDLILVAIPANFKIVKSGSTSAKLGVRK